MTRQDHQLASSFRPSFEALESRDNPATLGEALYLQETFRADVEQVFVGLHTAQFATTPAVRAMATQAMMAHYNHGLATLQLMQLHGVEVMWLNEDEQDNVDLFNHIDGPELDNAYIQFAVVDEFRNIQVASLAANNAIDPGIRANGATGLAVSQQGLAVSWHVAQQTGQDDDALRELD